MPAFESRCKTARGRAVGSIAHLRGLRLDFASTSEGAVNFTHDCDMGLAVDEVDRCRLKTVVGVVGW